MEGVESRGMPTNGDVISSYEFRGSPRNSCESNMINFSMIDLISCLSESLKIQSDQNSIRGSSTISPMDNDSICVVNEDESNNCDRKKMGSLSDGSVDVEEKTDVKLTAEVSTRSVPLNSANQPQLDSVSVPTPSKLVSAMKGSREKQGKLPQKLSVTWSPDVYDPTPSAESHVPSNRSHRHRSGGSKKNGKSKQKSSSGNSSRKGKDKKQLPRKSSSRSSSNRSERWYLDNYMMVSSGEPFPSIANYDVGVGSPDQFCGSSFLMTSVTKLHFPVGEAS